MWWLVRLDPQRMQRYPGPLRPFPNFRCKRYTGQDRPIYGRPMAEATVGREKLEVVSSLCYLGDALSLGGGCELATITRCRVAWGIFNESCPSSPPAHFPLPPEDEFTIRVSGMPCFMQAKRNGDGDGDGDGDTPTYVSLSVSERNSPHKLIYNTCNRTVFHMQWGNQGPILGCQPFLLYFLVYTKWIISQSKIFYNK